MKITNNCSFPIIAFGWHEEHGHGEDVEIAPGQFEDVSGPYLGEMGGGYCYIAIEGEVTCQENPDDQNGFQVIRGSQLVLNQGKIGITVRHHEESR